MISFATPGGSVGPHVDNYDVFLLQGLGRRRWGISREPLSQERLVVISLDERNAAERQIERAEAGLSLEEIYAEHTGRPVEEVSDALERDRYFTPEQARDYGLVDLVMGSRNGYSLSSS